MFANVRKECFLHFIGMTDISVIVSDINGNAKLFVYLGDCNKALTSREYPTAELLQFCESTKTKQQTLMQRSWATFTKTPNSAKYTEENI